MGRRARGRAWRCGARHDRRSRPGRGDRRLRRGRAARDATAEAGRQALAGARIPGRLAARRGPAFRIARRRLSIIRHGMPAGRNRPDGRVAPHGGRA
ncbi:Adenosylhomocysteinase [Burkholderia vietnamiensis]|nr:Adenosylhomocysteinase [Burkholderia vietnamiensis]CAG9192341.1 Adenosylhomocysteinase [Burkholderia vietnamiensis]